MEEAVSSFFSNNQFMDCGITAVIAMVGTQTFNFDPRGLFEKNELRILDFTFLNYFPLEKLISPNDTVKATKICHEVNTLPKTLT